MYLYWPALLKEWKVVSKDSVKRFPYYGFGGWLAVLYVFILFGFVVYVLETIAPAEPPQQYWIGASDDFAWQASAIVHLVLWVPFLVLAPLKHPWMPKVTILCVWAAFGVSAVALLTLADLPGQIVELLISVGFGLAFTALFASYLAFSKRVNATYLNRIPASFDIEILRAEKFSLPTHPRPKGRSRRYIFWILVAVLGLALIGAIVSRPISAADAGAEDKAVEAYARGDFATAYREWLPDAQNGNPVAQNNIALMYSSGKGVPRDLREALKWYRKAAAQGYTDAIYSIGVFHALGEAVPQDSREAARFWQKAAERGHQSAQYNLALLYANGDGVRRDFVYAYMWFDRSVSSYEAMIAEGFPELEKYRREAIEMRDTMTRYMTRAQTEDAQRLAREWKAKTE